MAVVFGIPYIYTFKVCFYWCLRRLLLKEIRRLRDEHEEASRSAAQIAQNPQLLAELKLLRQRKDELELRMSALQESRRELMVQLEGLMNLLKVSFPYVELHVCLSSRMQKSCPYVKQVTCMLSKLPLPACWNG